LWALGAMTVISLLVGLRPYRLLLATQPLRVLRRDVVARVWPLYPALENVNFRLKPGQMLGICGPTGAGKSTILSLIQRHFDVTQG
ncbi:ATP-binding cassette domain-containing protein, partial [Salmonella enterica subsp. enterica serovar Montevideo]|nr:ATP-binding cassette domain-containing protein [Salmonella enterica subsp. enterica serovar Montevideo]